MNLREIREECWSLARDTEATVDTDRLWPTNDMNRYINRVYRFIARETQCIKDTSTAAVCLISLTPVDYTTYTAGTLDYIWANDSSSPLYQQDVAPYLVAYHPSIIQIDEVRLMTEQIPLHKCASAEFKRDPRWEERIGTPTKYATDLESKKLALNYRAEVADTIRMSVRRMPLVDLVDDDDVPEIRLSYHDFMINGILEWMYSKRDAETLDEAKATEFGTKFLIDVDEIKQQESQMEERTRPNEALSAFL